MKTTLKAISATSATFATWLRGLWNSCSAILCAVIFYSSMPGVIPAWAADSTSFNPLTVSVQAQAISGVPVGTIISWPVYNNPEGWAEGNWLECNGQYISPSAYPELCAVVGSSVPDLRGLFLRGAGGNAEGLGTTQGDAIRNIKGRLGSEAGLWSGIMDTGAFYPTKWPDDGCVWGRGPNLTDDNAIGFDASRIVPTAEENRPVNRSVRYLIRARA